MKNLHLKSTPRDLRLLQFCFLLLFLISNKSANAQLTDTTKADPETNYGVITKITFSQEPIKKKLTYSVGSAVSLAFSGVNANITGEINYDRHTAYLGPKVSVADAYLPSTAPLGFVAGYKVFVNTPHGHPKGFDFFVTLDYQFQNHKAFRSNQNLPKRYNSLHELNAGYGLQYNFSSRFAVNNVLAFGRYLEVFRNPKSGTETQFDGYNRLIRVQLLYRIR